MERLVNPASYLAAPSSESPIKLPGKIISLRRLALQPMPAAMLQDRNSFNCPFFAHRASRPPAALFRMPIARPESRQCPAEPVSLDSFENEFGDYDFPSVAF